MQFPCYLKLPHHLQLLVNPLALVDTLINAGHFILGVVVGRGFVAVELKRGNFVRS